MNMKLDAESYLKSGSNELRVLEYRASGMSFGINILKVSKIVSELTDFTRVPESHPAVKGVFKDMNRLVPVIDLAAFLGVADENTHHEKVIVTEFFGVLTGFWVERIDWIHHFRWVDVIDAQQVFAGIDHRYIIGIVKPTEERMVLLLDYESMLLDLCPHLRHKETITFESDRSYEGKKILIAEDSPAVRSMLFNELSDLGFEVFAANDGVHGWEIYQKNPIDLVICDVEMPQMDGLALTLKIRQSEKPDTPVIVYSSIGDIGMKARAAFLKANAHITKLNFDLLLQTVDKLIRGENIDTATAEPEIPDPNTAVTVPVE
jgi:two-component system chemotaxis response regulator CheV